MIAAAQQFSFVTITSGPHLLQHLGKSNLARISSGSGVKIFENSRKSSRQQSTKCDGAAIDSSAEYCACGIKASELRVKSLARALVRSRYILTPLLASCSYSRLRRYMHPSHSRAKPRRSEGLLPEYKRPRRAAIVRIYSLSAPLRSVCYRAVETALTQHSVKRARAAKVRLSRCVAAAAAVAAITEEYQQQQWPRAESGLARQCRRQKVP